MIWFVLVVTSAIFVIIALMDIQGRRQLSISSVFFSLLAVGVLLSGLYFVPQYNVWQQSLMGQAELARAEQNRQIRIREAKAREEAATYEANAEITKAKAVAEANRIIADSVGGGEGYLRWRYIEMLEETGGQGRETIYIPTEAGMPILEANRR